MDRNHYGKQNNDDMFEELDLDSVIEESPEGDREPAPGIPTLDEFEDPLRDMEEESGEEQIPRPAPRTASPRTSSSRSASSARGERTAHAFGAGSYEEAPRKKVREVGSTDSSRKNASQEKQPKKKSRAKKIIICAIIEIITLAVIFAYGYFLRAWNSMTRPEVDEAKVANANLSASKIAEMEKGYFSFVVFGVDGRSASDLVSKGLNSDVIMVVNINMDTGEIRMCSIFRDTFLNISDKDKYAKINAAYAQGGPEQALAAINKNLDLNITNYVTFNWKAVVDGINILGGVDDIDISKSELYYINAFITETVKVTKVGSTQLTHTGPQHLDGVQAVAYGRLRLMDSDYSRVERQKKIIKACFEKAKKANFSVLNNIIVVCFPQVATNINFNDVVYMAQNITKFNLGESGGFPWQRSESYVGSYGDIIVPATLESNVKKLHELLYDDPDYQVSDALKRYSEHIKEATHVYKEGQVIESARTDGGLIPKPASASKGEAEGAETDENGETTTKKKEKKRVRLTADPEGKYEFPTDEDGNVEYETDEDGNLIFFEDEDGNIIYPKDEDGNEIRPTDADGNEIEEETERPDELDENAGDAPDAPGEETLPQETMAPGETKAVGPSELPRVKYTERSLETVPKTTEADVPVGPGAPDSGQTKSTGENAPGEPAEGGSTVPGGGQGGATEIGPVTDVPGGAAAPGGSTGGSSAPGGSSAAAPGGSSGGSAGGTSAPGSTNGNSSASAPGGANGSSSATAPGSSAGGSSSSAPGGSGSPLAPGSITGPGA